MNPKVDAFFDQAPKWQKELETLRRIILDCGLVEELKWGQPCYTSDGRNIVIINGLKEYCMIGFFKGALLFDTDSILSKPGENTQEGRLVKFTGAREIVGKEAILKAYIYEAIEVERAGVTLDTRKKPKQKIPEEFQKRLNKNATLNKAFYDLTPGRQRAYLLYFAQPKQSATRESRIDKWVPQILRGKGINDDYRK